MPFTTRPGVARRLLTFLLLRQKQSKQKKRRPCCLRPFASLRATCGAQQKRGHVQTRLAPQTSTCPDPLLLALLGAYRTAWAAGSDAALGSEIMTLWSFRALARVLRALFAIESVVLLLAGVGCLLRAGRGEPGGSSLSFASPKESNQRKGDPQSGALWATCEMAANRGSAQTRLRLKQRAALIPISSHFTGPARTGFGGNTNANAGFGSEVMDLWSFWAVACVLRALFATEFVVLLLAGVGCLLRAGRGAPGGSSLSFAPLNKSNSPAGATPRQQTQKQHHRPSYENSDNPKPLPC